MSLSKAFAVRRAAQSDHRHHVFDFFFLRVVLRIVQGGVIVHCRNIKAVDGSIGWGWGFLVESHVLFDTVLPILFADAEASL